MTSIAGIFGRQVVQALRVHDPRPAPPVVSRARWSVEQAQDWAQRTPWLLGANFIPSTAGNQLEMWQADTFDLQTIDRELGWAAELFGMNSMRIFMHDLLWQAEGEAFLDRIEQVLEVANSHGITVMPVLLMASGTHGLLLAVSVTRTRSSTTPSGCSRPVLQRLPTRIVGTHCGLM